jgi:hypothetical protein
VVGGQQPALRGQRAAWGAACEHHQCCRLGRRWHHAREWYNLHGAGAGPGRPLLGPTLST